MKTSFKNRYYYVCLDAVFFVIEDCILIYVALAVAVKLFFWA